MAKATTTAANLVGFMRPPYAHTHLPYVTAKDVDTSVLMQSLYRALRSRRPDGSRAEARFAAWVACTAGATMIDTAGNIHVDMRNDDNPERTLFTSHTDTVHKDGGTNQIRLDATDPERILWRAEKGYCLGADDGSGVALMMHMINAGVPGYYIFFRGEECGGVGSTSLAACQPKLLQEFDRCISFDRADQHDVITHQGGERCCSDVFAMALSDALLDDDMTLVFAPSDSGVFTDSANFTRLIPECTNLSVGYKHQHGDDEYQDVTFLRRLAKQLVQVQWEQLPTSRDPNEVLLRDAEPRRSMFSNHDSWGLPSKGTTLDEFEESVVQALEDASWSVVRPLHEMLAEWISADDPEAAMRHIDVRKVHVRELQRYADGIRSGEFDAYTVLDILQEDCYKE